MNKSSRKLLGSSIVVGFFTLLSRVFGLVRDLFIARFLGTGKIADAFFAAFRIPNVFRRIFAEGAFNNSFVPLFAESLGEGRSDIEGKAYAKDFAVKSFSVLFYILLITTILAEVFMPFVIHIFTPGFAEDPQKFATTVSFARIMFPFLMFVSIVAFFGGILNTLGKFAAVAAQPIMLNICMIAGLVFFAGFFPNAGFALSVAVAIAGVLQAVWLGMVAYKRGFGIVLLSPRKTAGTFKEGRVKRLLKNMLPGIAGGGIYHINIVVSTLFASMQDSAVSWLYFADRLNQLPLGVIGIAVSVVLLPMVSKQVKKNSPARISVSINRATEMSLFLMIPAAFAFWAIGAPIVSLLFERGKFTALDTVAVYQALQAYAIGLPAIVMLKLFSTAFYARKDTKTPMISAGFSFLLNVGFIFLLMKPLGFVGIALASSLAAWGQMLILYYFAYKKEMFLFFTQTIGKILRMGIASLFMYFILRFVMVGIMGGWNAEGVWMKILEVLLMIVGGGVVYILMLILLGGFDVKNLMRLKNMFKRKR